MRWVWVSAAINVVVAVLFFVAYRRATSREGKGLSLLLLVLALLAAASSVIAALIPSP